jgi:two-component system sensor histidine kinase/response regulator
LPEKSAILIVDDEQMARDIIEGFLYREGYNLAFATNGQEVLTYLERAVPDVILMDVMMPEMDGFEACLHLKSDKRWRHIPVILVTALGSTDDIVRGFEAGADDFLQKPVNDQELRARVRSMLRIKKQYDELQATMNMREDLVRMIMHDMRTPLTTIIGFSELLLLKKILVPEAVDTVNKIRAQAHELNTFVDDMLIVAKMESGRLGLNRILVDVKELVRSVEENHRIIAQSKSIQLQVKLPKETKNLLLDTYLFHRVLDNLISNALKFSPEESAVTLQVEYPEVSPPQLRIQVFDEGPGVPEPDRELIFDKFEVLSLKRQGVAQVGLGLAFCKMVVEAHDGRIFVEANKPEGAVFVIEI